VPNREKSNFTYAIHVLSKQVLPSSPAIGSFAEASKFLTGGPKMAALSAETYVCKETATIKLCYSPFFYLPAYLRFYPHFRNLIGVSFFAL
jgi:hypothetical protein